MITYREYVRLSRSGNSDDRGVAAHFAAHAYISHEGPADEHAALYAAVVSYLDDASVKVRAALAYGLLHSPRAPRPIMLALQDAPIIARAVAQYSPVLLEADLVAALDPADEALLQAVAARPSLGAVTAEALLRLRAPKVTLVVLDRQDIVLTSGILVELGAEAMDDAQLRGALLQRDDLPASLRLDLVEQVRRALSGARIVKGSIAPRRLDRLMRDLTDSATTAIGEREVAAGREGFVTDQIGCDRVTPRLMVRALVCGHAQFFAACVARLSGTTRHKVQTLLHTGSRPALHALLSRCGLPPAVGGLIIRLLLHARNANLSDNLAARYYVVTVLIEELIAEHNGAIPADLSEIFAYLNEQNIALARAAARGVMKGFADDADENRPMPLPRPAETLRLTAA